MEIYDLALSSIDGRSDRLVLAAGNSVYSTGSIIVAGNKQYWRARFLTSSLIADYYQSGTTTTKLSDHEYNYDYPFSLLATVDGVNYMVTATCRYANTPPSGFSYSDKIEIYNLATKASRVIPYMPAARNTYDAKIGFMAEWGSIVAISNGSRSLRVIDVVGTSEYQLTISSLPSGYITHVLCAEGGTIIFGHTTKSPYSTNNFDRLSTERYFRVKVVKGQTTATAVEDFGRYSTHKQQNGKLFTAASNKVQLWNASSENFDVHTVHESYIGEMDSVPVWLLNQFPNAFAMSIKDNKHFYLFKIIGSQIVPEHITSIEPPVGYKALGLVTNSDNKYGAVYIGDNNLRVIGFNQWSQSQTTDGISSENPYPNTPVQLPKNEYKIPATRHGYMGG